MVVRGRKLYEKDLHQYTVGRTWKNRTRKDFRHVHQTSLAADVETRGCAVAEATNEGEEHGRSCLGRKLLAH